MIRTIVNCCLRTRRNGAMKKTDRNNNNNNNKKNVVMYLLLFITLYFSVYYKWCAVKRNELLQRDNGYLLFFYFFFFLKRADDKWATVYATNNITAVRANCTADCDWPGRAAPAGALTLYDIMYLYIIYFTFIYTITHNHHTVRPSLTIPSR